MDYTPQEIYMLADLTITMLRRGTHTLEYTLDSTSLRIQDCTFRLSPEDLDLIAKVYTS